MKPIHFWNLKTTWPQNVRKEIIIDTVAINSWISNLLSSIANEINCLCRPSSKNIQKLKTFLWDENSRIIEKRSLESMNISLPCTHTTYLVRTYCNEHDMTRYYYYRLLFVETSRQRFLHSCRSSTYIADNNTFGAFKCRTAQVEKNYILWFSKRGIYCFYKSIFLLFYVLVAMFAVSKSPPKNSHRGPRKNR